MLGYIIYTPCQLYAKNMWINSFFICGFNFVLLFMLPLVFRQNKKNSYVKGENEKRRSFRMVDNQGFGCPIKSK